jgi:aminomethyltransferase
VITKVKEDHMYIVVNAGCRDKDLAHIEGHMKSFQAKGGDVSWHIHDERSLLALQGPLAAPVLQHLTKEDLSKMYFGDFHIIDINGSSCFLTRTGYTGEDGFEISVPSENAVDLAKAILEKSEGKIRLTGLGARDSLRLEAGLCLYGNDMEQHITPVEAGLAWAIGKRRRAEGGFLGAETILKQLADGPPIRRVGFISAGPPARSHSEIQNESGANIGEITSGGFSPCLKKNIAMGYVKSGQHKTGTKVKILIRGKAYDGTITKMPFVPAKYYRPS